MSDVVNESNGEGLQNQGCGVHAGPPCTDIGMKYGIFIGVGHEGQP